MLYSGVDLHMRSLVMQTLDTEQRWHGNPRLDNAGERAQMSRARDRMHAREQPPRTRTLDGREVHRSRCTIPPRTRHRSIANRYR